MSLESKEAFRWICRSTFPSQPLAGGSSDAAAVLVGMNRLFRLGLSLEELQQRGVKLGRIFHIVCSVERRWQRDR